MAYYQAPNPGAVKGIGDEVSGNSESFLTCEGEDCEKNIPLLKQIAPSESTYPQAQFCLGHCAFDAKEYDLAITSFREVLSHPDEFEELGNTRLSLILSLIASGKESDPQVSKLIEEGIEEGTPALQTILEEIQIKLNHPLRKLVN